MEIQEFAAELGKILGEYGDTVRSTVEEELDMFAGQVHERTVAGSPKRTGCYKKGWRRTEEKRFGTKYRIIHNKTRYRLAHLIERGAIRKNRGIMPATPHIGPAFDSLMPGFISQLKQKLGG